MQPWWLAAVAVLIAGSAFAQTAPPTKLDLTVPTWVAVGAGAADWSASFAACPNGVCRTITPLLPGIGRPTVATPLGLALDGVVLWSAHTWVGRRWPRVAEGLVYGLGIAHSITASHHVATNRARVRATTQ